MIEIRNFTKAYGKKIILENVNVTFPERKINFLMGPNGAGKTTLIKCLTRLENFEGTILIDDCDYIHIKDRFFVLWDDCPFYNNMKGIDNLHIFSEKRISKDKIIEKVSNFIDEDLLKKKVKNYSYGQRKKLALALVLLLEPEYIIMDEITNGLDYDTLKYLEIVIKEWAKTKTIIMTGHQFGFYNGVVENVYVYKNKGIERVDNFNQKKDRLEDIYNESVH